MQRTPPGSPSTSPTPGSSKGKGIGKGASNRNQDPPPHHETILESEVMGKPKRNLRVSFPIFLLHLTWKSQPV